MIVIVPVRVPVVVGVKVTPTVQLEVGVRGVRTAQLPAPPKAKSPPVSTKPVEKVRLELPVFVIVEYCTALVVLTV